jgi:hypothetical protein
VAPLYRKDPDETLDYGVDWSAWLGGDLIQSSVWTASPAGITLGVSTNTATATAVWVSGGSVGSSYDVVNRITTLAGRVKDQTLRFVMEQH